MSPTKNSSENWESDLDDFAPSVAVEPPAESWWDGAEPPRPQRRPKANPARSPRRFQARRAKLLSLATGCIAVVVGAILVTGSLGADRSEIINADQDRASPVSPPAPAATASASAPPAPIPASSPVPVPEPGPTALAALESIPIKGRAPKTGYDREVVFGEAWLDVDGNGCTTRDDILARDLVNIDFRDRCIAQSGQLSDPYTGQLLEFERGWGSSLLVQIDHVVALSNAWQTGAQQLSQDQRVEFANDPLNLLAVDGAANQQKSDGDAATWLPANKAFRCTYVARQVSVKVKYGLWVTPPEYDAIKTILSSCPDEPVAAG